MGWKGREDGTSLGIILCTILTTEPCSVFHEILTLKKKQKKKKKINKDGVGPKMDYKYKQKLMSQK